MATIACLRANATTTASTVPVTSAHRVMLDKKLLYTAITRAKTNCFLIGDSDAFRQALLREGKLRRQTVLQYLASSN